MRNYVHDPSDPFDAVNIRYTFMSEALTIEVAKFSGVCVYRVDFPTNDRIGEHKDSIGVDGDRCVEQWRRFNNLAANLLHMKYIPHDEYRALNAAVVGVLVELQSTLTTLPAGDRKDLSQ